MVWLVVASFMNIGVGSNAARLWLSLLLLLALQGIERGPVEGD